MSTPYQKIDFQEFSRSFYIFQKYFPEGILHSKRFQLFPVIVSLLDTKVQSSHPKVPPLILFVPKFST